MEKINWSKGIGYGVLIWAIMFAFVSALAGLGLYDAIITKIIVVLAAGILSYLFAQNIKPIDLSQAFFYGVIWIVVGMVLDLIISMQFSGIVFSTWEYWLGYALILLASMLGSSRRDVGISRKRTTIRHAHSR